MTAAALPGTTRVLLGIAFMVVAAMANAHHSFAMFDPSKVVNLEGTVKEFDWSNPHVSIWVNVPSANGGPVEVWTVELTSPGNLTRLGWSRRSLKPGDRVRVEINPLRSGARVGGFRKVTLLDTGQVLTGALRDLERRGAR